MDVERTIEAAARDTGITHIHLLHWTDQNGSGFASKSMRWADFESLINKLSQAKFTTPEGGQHKARFQKKVKEIMAAFFKDPAHSMEGVQRPVSNNSQPDSGVWNSSTTNPLWAHPTVVYDKGTVFEDTYVLVSRNGLTGDFKAFEITYTL